MNELIVLLHIDGRRAAIPAVEVRSVIELEDIYPVPRSPEYVVGLTAMRSRSLTVIDCRRAIGLPGQNDSAERAPVVEIDGHLYALLVDAVDDVIEAKSDMKPVAGGFGDEWQRVARGMIETDHGPTLMIDAELLIQGPAAKAA